MFHLTVRNSSVAIPCVFCNLSKLLLPKCVKEVRNISQSAINMGKLDNKVAIVTASTDGYVKICTIRINETNLMHK